MPIDHATDDLLAAAREGDEAAFTRLVAPLRARLRSVAYRICGHPDDAEDIVQESLLRAYRGMSRFRSDSTLSTWLHRITVRTALNYLRDNRRWPVDVQQRLREEYSQELSQSATSPVRDPEFGYSAAEHIAFCFTCVARNLDPLEQAAVLLRDVFELTNAEAAEVAGLSVPQLRHALARGRAQMTEAYDDLCRLVSKRGVCYQCAELREALPEAVRGPDVPVLRLRHDRRSDVFARRAAVTREADLESGPSARMHAEMFRRIGEMMAGRS
ncbi:MAG: sigma-70 family RNA polymerase sigma factor [Polyangiaceae bacterium]